MSGRPATLSGPRTPARGPAGATAIVAALAGAGTRVMFGVPGGGPNLDVVGAAAAAGLRFVLTHTETAAAIMAATSADLTGTPGAVLVTRGPGTGQRDQRDRPRGAGPATPGGDRRHGAGGRGGPGQPSAAGPGGAGRAGGQGGADGRRGQAGPAAAQAGPPGARRPARSGDRADGRRGRGGRPARDPTELAAPSWATEGPPGGRRRPVTSGRWPPRCARPGGRSCCSARRLSRTPPPSGPPWPAAGSPRCTPTGRVASCPTPAAEAAGLVTGGTMEWPLLAHADLIVGLGVDEAEMIPAAWDYPAPTVLVSEWPAERTGLEAGARHAGARHAGHGTRRATSPPPALAATSPAPPP